MTDSPVYSSFSRRFAALLLDGIVLLIPAYIAHLALPLLGSIVIALAYKPIFESSPAQATPGKRLMGIQVTDLNGGRITLRAALIRYFVSVGSSLVLFIGHFFFFFTPRKQTLHDLLADTLVVQGESSVPLGDAWMSEIRSAFGSEHSHLGSAGPAYSRWPRTEATLTGELERLAKLRADGALTEAEFQVAKQEVLSRSRS